MLILLRPMDKESKVFFEASCPSRDRRSNPIEIEIVPLLPDAPGSSGKDIDEHQLLPIILGEGNQIQSVSCNIIGEGEVQTGPAVLTEITVKEEMLHSLFNPSIAHSAVKSISHMVMPSSQHIPCVKSVR